MKKGNRHAEVCRRFPQEIYGSNPTSREEPKNKGKEKILLEAFAIKSLCEGLAEVTLHRTLDQSLPGLVALVDVVEVENLGIPSQL